MAAHHYQRRELLESGGGDDPYAEALPMARAALGVVRGGLKVCSSGCCADQARAPIAFVVMAFPPTNMFQRVQSRILCAPSI